MRFTITNAFVSNKNHIKGFVISGRVECGVLEAGKKYIIRPFGTPVSVKTVAFCDKKA